MVTIFDQSDECCFSNWDGPRIDCQRDRFFGVFFSTEGIKWNYSKLFQPHTYSISTFCKISPHFKHVFPITTTGIWLIHTVPSSSLARDRRDASSQDLLPAVAKSRSHRSRSCLPQQGVEPPNDRQRGLTSQANGKWKIPNLMEVHSWENKL